VIKNCLLEKGREAFEADAEGNLGRLVCSLIAKVINGATKLQSCFNVDTQISFLSGFMRVFRVLVPGYHFPIKVTRVLIE
jgi:hypothetical protein